MSISRVSPSRPLTAPNWAATIAGSLSLATGAALLSAQGSRPVSLLVIGGLLGITLYFATFGFASAYRDVVVHRRTSGLIAQALMLALTTAAFAPILSAGEVFGRPVVGAYAPFNAQVAVGALLFGVGMQLARGCGSGTLFTIGGGSARMVITLVLFCAGSFLASLHMHWWQRLPSAGTIVLGESLGWGIAAALQLAALTAGIFVLRRWSDRRWTFLPGGHAWWHGPWPLIFGAVALGVLNLATLITAGHPWSITWAFTLWGAKLAALLGWNPSTSPFWSAGYAHEALQASVLRDTTSIMDVGIILGALLAAGLSGRFAPRLNLTPRSATTALLGGLLMGYGSRIAYGCNIGAFFSGVASTSLHGWHWFAAAMVGSAIGVRLHSYIDAGSGQRLH